MSTLKEDINRAVIAIHRETKKEWIPLKEIYEKVEEIRKKTNANKGASIRASLETHCPDCITTFSGNALYRLKEKGSGLYKSIYYDQIIKIENLSIGETFTRDELMNLFKISGQSGMMKTNSLDALVLTTSPTNGTYKDSDIENGKIIYTGEGLIGDQELNKNNKTLFDSYTNNTPVYLFTKDKYRRYTFEGRVELCDNPYQIEETDSNREIRKVWKFPLHVLYPEENITTETDENLKIIIEKVELLNEEVMVTVSNSELVFIDEPLKIRKFRPASERKKKNRNSKPDYIAEEIVKNKQGIINEKLIYENEIKELLEKNAIEQVEEMRKFFENKKENEGYDILSFELDSDGKYIEKYIEVKSTKGDESTPIDITDNEVEFAKKHINQYYLYRVIKSDSNDRYVKVVKGKDLFKNYTLEPTTYKIYSN